MLAPLLLATALGQAPPAPIDISDVKAALRVLTDGSGHYVVFHAPRPYDGHLYYGDGKTFTAQRTIGGGMNGDESWSVSLWDPRHVPHSSGYASVEMRDSGAMYEVACSRRKTPFTRLPPAEAEKILASATFLPFRWTRYPERLMRDDSGNYFFVDRLRTESPTDRRDFRVFMGPRGKMRQLPLKDIVDDTQGTIFATADGTLRLVAGGARSLKWVVGKKETALIEVPVEDNARMIYVDLGPYAGQRLGTPCDDLM